MAREPKQKPGMPRSGKTGDGNIKAPPPGGFEGWRKREPLPTSEAPIVRASDFVEEDTIPGVTIASEDLAKAPDPGGCGECVGGWIIRPNPAGKHLDPVSERCTCAEGAQLVPAAPAAPVVVEAEVVEPAPAPVREQRPQLVINHESAGALFGRLSDVVHQLHAAGAIDRKERDRRLHAIEGARKSGRLVRCRPCGVVWGHKAKATVDTTASVYTCPRCGEASQESGKYSNPKYPADVAKWRELFPRFAMDIARIEAGAKAAPSDRVAAKEPASVDWEAALADFLAEFGLDDEQEPEPAPAPPALPPPAAPKLTAAERARAAWGVKAV